MTDKNKKGIFLIRASRFRARLDKLTARQRKYTVLIALGLFLIADIYVIISGFSGKAGTRIEHIESVKP